MDETGRNQYPFMVSELDLINWEHVSVIKFDDFVQVALLRRHGDTSWSAVDRWLVPLKSWPLPIASFKTTRKSKCKIKIWIEISV
jgi:hypothetical protein